MAQEVGKTIGILLCSGVVFVALAIPANAQGDTTPPKLQALSVSTNLIDTSGGPQDVTATATVTDDLSGVNFVSITFGSPSGSLVVQSFGFVPVSGDTYVGDLTFPQFSPEGVWTIVGGQLLDNVGNSARPTNAELQKRGINVVIGNGSFETAYSREISRLNYSKKGMSGRVSAKARACQDGTPVKLQRKRSAGWNTISETWLKFNSFEFRHLSLKTGAKYRVYIPSYALGTPVVTTCGKASQKFMLES